MRVFENTACRNVTQTRTGRCRAHFVRQAGSGDSSVVEKSVLGSSPCRSGRRIFFSMVNCLCWLFILVFVPPSVTVVWLGDCLLLLLCYRCLAWWLLPLLCERCLAWWLFVAVVVLPLFGFVTVVVVVWTLFGLVTVCCCCCVTVVWHCDCCSCCVNVVWFGDCLLLLLCYCCLDLWLFVAVVVWTLFGFVAVCCCCCVTVVWHCDCCSCCVNVVWFGDCLLLLLCYCCLALWLFVAVVVWTLFGFVTVAVVVWTLFGYVTDANFVWTLLRFVTVCCSCVKVSHVCLWMFIRLFADEGPGVLHGLRRRQFQEHRLLHPKHPGTRADQE